MIVTPLCFMFLLHSVDDKTFYFLFTLLLYCVTYSFSMYQKKCIITLWFLVILWQDRVFCVYHLKYSILTHLHNIKLYASCELHAVSKAAITIYFPVAEGTFLIKEMCGRFTVKWNFQACNKCAVMNMPFETIESIAPKHHRVLCLLHKTKSR